jgi:hypothetical protein
MGLVDLKYATHRAYLEIKIRTQQQQCQRSKEIYKNWATIKETTGYLPFSLQELQSETSKKQMLHLTVPSGL